MHYFQFNIGDYASHTSRLSPMEDLAYRRLLDLYYLNEQPLNGCVTDVAREIGLVEHALAVEYVLTKFFTLEENVFKQKRIDLEIKKYKSNAKNKSKAGKASAKARRTKASEVVTPVEQTLNTTPTPEQLNSNHKPLTINQEPLTNNQLVTKDVKPAKASNDALEIFNYWKDVMKKGPTTTLSAKRMKKVKERLAEGKTVEFIKQAIYGCSITPHNNGTDPKGNGQKYDDLELICRSSENIERFADNANLQPMLTPNQQSALSNWHEEPLGL